MARGPRAAACRPERRERSAQQRPQAALPESAIACRQGPAARWAQRRPQEGSAKACRPERREPMASQRSLAARRRLGALARRPEGRRRAEWLPLAGSEAAWALGQRWEPGRQEPQRLPGLSRRRALEAVARRAFLGLPADRPVGQTRPIGLSGLTTAALPAGAAATATGAGGATGLMCAGSGGGAKAASTQPRLPARRDAVVVKTVVERDRANGDRKSNAQHGEHADFGRRRRRRQVAPIVVFDVDILDRRRRREAAQNRQTRRSADRRRRVRPGAAAGDRRRSLAENRPAARTRPRAWRGGGARQECAGLSDRYANTSNRLGAYRPPRCGANRPLLAAPREWPARVAPGRSSDKPRGTRDSPSACLARQRRRRRPRPENWRWADAPSARMREPEEERRRRARKRKMGRQVWKRSTAAALLASPR